MKNEFARQKEESMNKIDDLNDQIKEIEDKKQQLIEDHQSELINLSTSFQDRQDDEVGKLIDELTNTNREHQKEMHAKQLKLDELEKEKNTLQDELDQQKRQNADLSNSIKKLEVEKKDNEQIVIYKLLKKFGATITQ